MEENHMGWKLVRGVRQDLISLFRLFAKTNSVRFEDFSKVWKEMKFSLIFRHRVTFVELLEFTEEVLQIVKEYLLSVYEFPTRVAALYTLYGLYFKQPFREAAKIRFTKSEWEEVYKLILHCKAEKHYDVVFIHLKMYLSGAYNFTATIRTAGLENGFRKYSKKRNSIYANNCDLELLYRPVMSEKLVDTLVQLELLYCKKKTELLGKRNIEFIDGNFAKSLQKDLRNYESKCKRLTSNSKGVSSGNDDNVVQEVVEDGDDNNENDEDVDKGIVNMKHNAQSSKRNEDGETGDDKKEKKENNKTERKEFKREKFGNKYLELIAKKKAEFCIRILHQKYDRDTDSENSNFSLPDLDFS